MDRVRDVIRELIAPHISGEEVILLEIENVGRGDLLEGDLHVARPAFVFANAQWADHRRPNIEFVDDEVDRERAVRPELAKEERERPPGVEERDRSSRRRSRYYRRKFR